IRAKAKKLLTREAIEYSLTSYYMRLNDMGTAYLGNEQEVRALNAYIKLMRAAETVTSRLNRNLASADLTVSQFGVLEALHHKGALCQRDIAAKILKSTGNITMVIDNLEKHGLVRRERGAEDRRYITIILTEKGTQLIAELFPRHAAAITDEMGVLTEEEQAELGRLCRKLGLKEKGVKIG
ncbi:MAG TPA: MarR family transcriptional regulator, partial [Anaerolineales bacterium]|nr:MarR family transcriptional regulator [Anaerolineales bacterium]